MKDLSTYLPDIISQAQSADTEPLRQFLLKDSRTPLVATGSGGALAAADFAALLYGTRDGIATAVSPYTMNSLSDAALASSKVLLVSKGGHNNDVVFAAKRSLGVNPACTASLTLSTGEGNEVRKTFLKAGAPGSIDLPMTVHEGFVPSGTPLAFFALLVRAFDRDCDLGRFSEVPEQPYRSVLADGTALPDRGLKGIRSFTILHGGWGRPVAVCLEGKLTESGLAQATVSDFRNYCHGRFIHTSNHLEDTAVVMLVTPRERDLAERIRKFLPDRTRLFVVETPEDSPAASLDLLIRSTALFEDLCAAEGTNPDCPPNPGRIDKRVPIWIPFIKAMKDSGPLGQWSRKLQAGDA